MRRSIDPDFPVRHVDIFLRDDLKYESLRPCSELVPFRGRTLRVVSRAKLLQIKLAIEPPRLKDQIDIEFLRRDDNQTG